MNSFTKPQCISSTCTRTRGWVVQMRTLIWVVRTHGFCVRSYKSRDTYYRFLTSGGSRVVVCHRLSVLPHDVRCLYRRYNSLECLQDNLLSCAVSSMTCERKYFKFFVRFVWTPWSSVLSPVGTPVYH